MIDGALKKPFFARNQNNEIIGADTIAYWFHLFFLLFKK